MQAWVDSDSEEQTRTPIQICSHSPCTPITSHSTRHSLGDFSTPDSRKSSISSYGSKRTPNNKLSQFSYSARRSSIDRSPCEDFFKSFDVKPSEFSLEVFRQDGIRLEERREIRSFLDSNCLGVTDLQSLKDCDPVSFENLRKNGYRRDSKSTRICELF